MNKFIIILLGVLLLSSMVYITGCVAEEDDGYTSCDGTCDYDNPYSNQHTSNCYASKSECENDTGNSCSDCS